MQGPMPLHLLWSHEEEQNGTPPIPTSDDANDNESTGAEGTANGDA